METEEREVTVSALELEPALEEEVKVEDLQRFFRPCRWINSPFTRLRVLAEAAVAVAEETSKAEDGCVPGGEVVGREVDSGGVRCHRYISLIWRLGGNAIICFHMPAQTEWTSYSIVGGGVLCWWRRTLSVAEVEAKREVDANCEEL